MQVCFLLLDVYLLQQLADKAAEVLAFLERMFATLTKSVDKPGENGTAAAADGEGSPAKGEWPNKRSARRPPTEISPDEVRGALNLYKAKLSLAGDASKSSKREIKTALAACKPDTTGLFLKCQLEYLRQNYRKAIKLLNNSCQPKGEKDLAVAALYFNNMGCIHHCMGRHAAAAFYFTKALAENDHVYATAPREGSGVALPAYACDRRAELAYNRALQHLYGGRPEAAFHDFHGAVALMHRQPRLWLRMGEACAAAHSKGAGAATDTLAGPGALTDAVIGRAAPRRLVLPATDLAGRTDAAKAAAAEGADEGAAAAAAAAVAAAAEAAAAEPSPTLAYGIKCLRNALALCDAQLAAAAAPEYAALAASSAQGTLTSTDAHSLHLHTVHRLSLLQLAWASLESSDPLHAFAWASQLLAADALTPTHKLFAHLYAADALCALSRPQEALDHLTSAMQLDVPAADPAAAEAAADGVAAASGRNPYSPIPQTAQAAASAAARVVLSTNLATAHILAGDLPSASAAVRQALALQPDNRHALLCRVYLDLRQGNVEAARAILHAQRVPASPS